jgi:hypothetical protein
MANEWIVSDSAACYDSTSVFQLVQADLMEIGKLYTLNFTISNQSQGKLSIPTIEGTLEYTEDGSYTLLGIATYTDLVFLPSIYGAGMFDGCIDVVELREVPFYSIMDCNDNEVFALEDSTGVTTANEFVQYQIDWSDLVDGIYYLKFENSSLEYRSDCFDVKTTHACTKQITWNCNEDAFEFNYSDLSFTQSLRIGATMWKPKFKATEKEVYEFSNGDLKINYVSLAKEYIITTEEIPEYVFDAISLALNSDNLFIDGVKYVFPDDEVSPSWRNSSNLAPLEFVLRKSQNLKNSNC